MTGRKIMRRVLNRLLANRILDRRQQKRRRSLCVAHSANRENTAAKASCIEGATQGRRSQG
jgi:hypothetical protein